MNDNITPVAYVTFERSIRVREFENAKATITLPIPLEDVGVLTADGEYNSEAIVARSKEAFLVAKTTVFEQLGIEFTVDPNLVATEILEKALAAVEVGSEARARLSEASSQASQSAGPSRQGGGDKLTGRAAWEDLQNNPSKWFDNRADKAAGKGSPKGPDFKRKGTGEALWVKGRGGESMIPDGIVIPAA